MDSPRGNMAKSTAADGSVGASDGDGFTFSTELSLEEIRKMQAEFASERGWNKYHTPRNLLLAMVGEVGELSEIFQWRGEVEPGLPGWSSEDKEHLGQEISDVLIYLVRLADRCKVDLPPAVVDKIKLNSVKYPASRVYGQSLKYTAYQGSGSEPTDHEGK